MSPINIWIRHDYNKIITIWLESWIALSFTGIVKSHRYLSHRDLMTLCIITLKDWNRFDTSQDFLYFVLLPCLKHKSDSSLTALIAQDSILGQLVRVFQSWWRYLYSVRAATKAKLSLKLHCCQRRHLNTLCPLKFTDYCCPPAEVRRSIGGPILQMRATF